MTNIYVKVEQTQAFDTKYLFPGLVSHHHEDVDYDGPGAPTYYSYDVGSGSSKKHFLFTTQGGTPGDTDISGYMPTWNLMNNVKKTVVLASFWVLFDPGEARPTISSLGELTPNRIVDAMADAGETAKFFFIGNKGNDTLRGSKAADTFDGGKGADSMIGSKGGDKYYVDNSGDKIVEKASEGSDSVITKINYTLPAFVESLTADGSGDFALTGNASRNGIVGSSGDDTLKGGGGGDSLLGGAGRDVLYGGSGIDQFMFFAAPGAAHADVIKDFSPVDDFMALSRAAFAGLTNMSSPVGAHLLPPTAFHASKSGKAHDYDDRIAYDTDDGRVFFDADGIASGPRQLIATLTGHPHLTAGDFIIF